MSPYPHAPPHLRSTTCRLPTERAKSTGPRTASGKAKSRLNAYKHGLTAKLPLLPFEDAADFQALKDGFEADFAPRNTYQKFLTHQLATHAWRILRSQQVEVGLQEMLLKQTIRQLESQGYSADQALQQNPYAGLSLTLQPQKNDPQLQSNQPLPASFRPPQKHQPPYANESQLPPQPEGAPPTEPRP